MGKARASRSAARALLSVTVLLGYIGLKHRHCTSCIEQARNTTAISLNVLPAHWQKNGGEQLARPFPAAENA
jgi:hypothetical protein